MRVLNNYTDEFRRNVVSVVRSGMKPYDVAKRLDLPVATIWGWLRNNKYASIGPATDEVLAALPPRPLALPRSSKTSLVKVAPKEEAKLTEKESSSVRISYGKLTIEFSNGLNSKDLKVIIQALGGRNVL